MTASLGPAFVMAGHVGEVAYDVNYVGMYVTKVANGSNRVATMLVRGNVSGGNAYSVSTSGSDAKGRGASVRCLAK